MLISKIYLWVWSVMTSGWLWTVSTGVHDKIFIMMQHIRFSGYRGCGTLYTLHTVGLRREPSILFSAKPVKGYRFYSVVYAINCVIQCQSLILQYCFWCIEQNSIRLNQRWVFNKVGINKEASITAGHYQYNEQEQEVFTNQNIWTRKIRRKHG